MPLFLPDPTYAATQARPRKQRTRLWVPPGVPPAPVTFLNDTFTDTNGVLLENHVGEVGATWTKHTGWAGVGTVQANRIWGGSGEAHYYASGVPLSPDYDVTATIFDVSNQDVTLCGPMGRMVVGTNTGYAAFVILSGGVTYVYLKKFVNGTATDLANNSTITALVVGSSHTLTLRMQGSSLAALWDGVSVVTTTDTAITAAGRAGIIHNGVSASNTGYHIDSISAT